MPIKESAIKALRQSKKKQIANLVKKRAFRKALKEASKPGDLPRVQSAVDKAAKAGCLHKNKASRLKSRVAAKFKLTGKSAAKAVSSRRAPIK